MAGKVTIKTVRSAVQALGEGGKEISYGLIYEALGLEDEAEKDMVRARIGNMVKHGEVTRTERGAFVYNFKNRPRKGTMLETIWRFVRAAKPGWSIEDGALMTRASYTHVLRYVAWLEGEGFVERTGRNERNAIIFRNTGKARSHPETPYPPARATDPFAKERMAAATITRLMLCADPYALKTGRQICEACRILLDRFDKGNGENADSPREGDAALKMRMSRRWIMLSEELKSIHAALGRLLGKLDPESADFLRRARRNLDEAVEEAKNMEEHFYPTEAA